MYNDNGNSEFIVDFYDFNIHSTDVDTVWIRLLENRIVHPDIFT